MLKYSIIIKRIIMLKQSVVFDGLAEKLLPLIHKLWPPFAHRFNDSEEIVVMKV